MRTFFKSVISKLRRPVPFTKKYWNSIGKVHSDMGNEALNAYFEEIITYVQPIEGEIILDIGCGEGSLTKKIEEYCDATLIGLDFSKKLLKMAKKKGVPSIILADALRLPFKNNCMDKVYSFGVMQYISNKKLKTSVLESMRVVKMGGTIYLLEVPNKSKVFDYYCSFRQKCFYSLSLLFRGGLFSQQIGYWHEEKVYQTISEELNLDFKMVSAKTYRMNVILRTQEKLDN
jgi:ubiquinone/menaquinone biosynthesis C-methylase UbiE